MTDTTALTPQEVADILRIAKNTVYELIKRGELNGYRVGKKVRVDLQDVEEYKNRTKQARPSAPESPGAASGLRQIPQYHESASIGNFIICGQDALLDILSRYLEAHSNGTRALRSYIGSYNGLYALYQGKVHVASAHMWDSETNTYNVPYVSKMLPGVPAMVINLASRTQGFYVAKGNPKNIRTWKDLAREGVSIVNREKGSGVRILLDEHLRKLRILPRDINGYDREYSSHLAIASAVARGEADAGIGNEKTGLQVPEIDFIPLQKENYDLIMKKEDQDKPVFQAIIEIIRSKEFITELKGLGGYDVAKTGQIIAET
ncbi:MAG: helix-turn-helix transcriptional regulator [Clostridia bacterium]|nr:helix-turn-helix transcriptional regulator [Clostridia bacterium]